MSAALQMDPVVIESASQHLQRVKLAEGGAGMPILKGAASGHSGLARRAAGPAPHETSFSPSTTSTLLSLGDSSLDAVVDQAESKMRECFSEAFDKEVEYLSSLNITVTKERKRQILADILVWAEVTQQHYDTTTRSFVLEPNQHDESFLRVGRYLLDAKRLRGV